MTTASVRVSTSFHDADRCQQSWLAPAERRCLLWLAEHTPPYVSSDHLTLAGFMAMVLAGACYRFARWWPPALLFVNFWLALNWLGDSLDGTLARVRRRQRPRYGFYVDHIVDSFGALCLLAGLGCSGYMSWPVAVALLLSFYLLSINSYLATYTLGTFQLSFFRFSPTELRILLAVGNTVALFRPVTTVFGMRLRFFDAGGGIGAACMTAVLLVSVVRNTLALYRMEPL
jgi:archaetidylinositol phosphate synthase